jgi:hypothetical protein
MRKTKSVTPHILNLSSRCRWVVSLTHQLLYYWERYYSNNWVGGLMCPSTILDTLEKRSVVKLMDVPFSKKNCWYRCVVTFSPGGKTVKSDCCNGTVKKYGYSLHLFHLFIKMWEVLPLHEKVCLQHWEYHKIMMDNVDLPPSDFHMLVLFNTNHYDAFLTRWWRYSISLVVAKEGDQLEPSSNTG